MAWFIDETRVWRLHIQYQEEGVWPLVTVWIDVKKLLRLRFTDHHLQAKHQSTFPTSTYLTITRAQKQTHNAGKSHPHFKDKETRLRVADKFTKLIQLLRDSFHDPMIPSYSHTSNKGDGGWGDRPGAGPGTAEKHERIVFEWNTSPVYNRWV